MSTPPRIGLTGGIASGKTTVANLFAELGATVIDTDIIAREIVAPGQPALNDIAAAFGAEVLQPDGSLDRAALRTRVFASAEDRKRLEAITHPRIRAEALRQAAVAVLAPLAIAQCLRDAPVFSLRNPAGKKGSRSRTTSLRTTVASRRRGSRSPRFMKSTGRWRKLDRW